MGYEEILLGRSERDYFTKTVECDTEVLFLNSEIFKKFLINNQGFRDIFMEKMKVEQTYREYRISSVIKAIE